MVYLIIGVILILIVATDIVYTVLSSNGAGYLSKYAMKYTAALFQFAARRTGSRTVLKFAGVSLLSSITVVWIALLWVGVFLVFYSDRLSVFDSKTEVPAGFIDRVYFAGYLLSTLGNGDFEPASGAWQIVAVLFTFSGFIFLTTGITYFVSILSAVTEKRQAAIAIFDLGASSEEIAGSFKKLNRAGALMSVVSGLENHINRLTLNHTSYPISHYFFAVEKNRSISVAAANLNFALEELAAEEDADENLKAQLESLRTALDRYLQTLAERFLSGLLKDANVARDAAAMDKNVRRKTIEALLYSDVFLDDPPR